MKTYQLFRYLRNYITILIFLSNCGILYSQTIDSIGITIFFNLQNRAQITDSSRDSIFKLVGKNEKLQDTYYYSDARFKLQIGKFDEAMQIANDRNSNLPNYFSEYYKAKYYNIIGSVYANKQDIKKAIVFFRQSTSFRYILANMARKII